MDVKIPPAVEPLVSKRGRELLEKTVKFVREECIPADKAYFEFTAREGNTKRWVGHAPVVDELKKKARSLGLWNLFLHRGYPEGPGLTNVEYALIAEATGYSIVAPEALNCSAPDTGNMEVLAKYGTPEQKERWLKPLMAGEIRSAFAMTEHEVASSDATNVQTSIVRQGDGYVINGRKSWISGAGDDRCALYLVLGKTDPHNASPHRQQSIVIVPANTPGCTVVRPYTLFGYDDAPHGHMQLEFKNVYVPKENMILGEARGFEVIQGRLGPGRLHHCMRTIGASTRALNLMLARVTDPARQTFGRPLSEHGTIKVDLAEMRIGIESCRMLVLNAAARIDAEGAKAALAEIAMAKIQVPRTALGIIDRAQQAWGAAGIGQDTILPYLYASIRTLRYADGPDEVHLQQLGRLELKRAPTVTRELKAQGEIRPIPAKL